MTSSLAPVAIVGQASQDLRARFIFTSPVLWRRSSRLPIASADALPRQLAARLPADTVRVNAPVETVEAGGARVAGTRVESPAVVVATDGEAARGFVPTLPAVRHNATACLSSAAESDPVRVPMLVLDAERSGPVNHLCVPSAVSPSYAPARQALVSASVISAPGKSDLQLGARPLPSERALTAVQSPRACAGAVRASRRRV